jgi:hypothetical protein
MGNIGTYPPQNVSAQTPVLAETTIGSYSTSTSNSVVPGLSATITVPAGRRIKISLNSEVSVDTASHWSIYLQQDGVDIARLYSHTFAAAWYYDRVDGSYVITPSAGQHTYTIKVTRWSGSGNIFLNAENTVSLLIEDISGSQLPVLPQSVPVGLLGHARVTTNQSAITTGSPINGLSVNVSVPDGRILKIRAEAYFENSAVNAVAGARMFIQQNGSNIQQVDHRLTAANIPEKFIGEVIVSPSAGSHTFRVFADNGTGGTVQLIAGAAYPAILTVEDITPTPSPSSGAPGSTLGYAEVTANQTGITGANVPINGLSTTVTVPAGRRIRVTAYGHAVATGAVPDRLFFKIFEDGVEKAMAQVTTDSTGLNQNIIVSRVLTPAAGTHTYDARLAIASGAGTFVADASQVAFILVEDITGSIWPASAVPQHTVLGTTTLGYAELTSNSAGFTGLTEISALSVSVNVPAGRRIRISAKGALAATSGTPQWASMYIHEGTTMKANWRIDTPLNVSEGVAPSVILTPSAGTHTYTIKVECDTGTCVLAANANEPAYILVEDITGVADPYQPESVPVGALAWGMLPADQTVGTTLTAVNGCTLNVTVPAGRTLKISAHCNFYNTVASSNQVLFGAVFKDGVEVSTLFASAPNPVGSFGDHNVASGFIIDSPSAGSHTYQLRAGASNTGMLVLSRANNQTYFIVEDITPTPAPSTGAPGSTLAYAEVRAVQNSITSEVDLTGLTTTVTVPAGRRLRISAHASIQNSLADARTDVNIKEGSTILQRGFANAASANLANTLDLSTVITPTAGTHTYKLTGFANTGVGKLDAGADYPAYILVEDITGSVWPEGVPVTPGMVASEAWNTWVPQLDNGTLGNGTLTARWTRIGRTVTVSFFWIFGSSSDISSWFSVSNFPVAAHAAAGGVGPVFMSDSSTGNRAVGVVVVSGTVGTIFSTIGGNGHVNNTYPWDWATGDGLQFTVTYEAAS